MTRGLIPLASVAVAPGKSRVMKVKARAAVGVPTTIRTAPTMAAVQSSDVEFLNGRFVVFICAEFTKNLACLSRQPSASANHRFKFQKLRPLFIGVHNESLSVVVMRVSNEDRPPVTIYSCNTAPIPSGFAEIVGDDFPVLHGGGFCLFCSPHGNEKVIEAIFPITLHGRFIR